MGKYTEHLNSQSKYVKPPFKGKFIKGVPGVNTNYNTPIINYHFMIDDKEKIFGTGSKNMADQMEKISGGMTVEITRKLVGTKYVYNVRELSVPKSGPQPSKSFDPGV